MNEKIYTSKPINKTAKLVTSNQPNDEMPARNYGGTYMSLERPPIMPFHSRNNNLNLHGLTFGKLTVIGAFIKQTPRKKTKWVVQCKCGYYTVRISNIIRRKIKDNEYDECKRCNQVSRKKNPLIL